MCVAAAIAGGAVAGGAISAVGANSAANTQASAQNSATAEQESMFNTINGQEQPFMQAGYGATSSLQKLLGLTGGAGPGGLPNGYLDETMGPFSFNPSSITSSPGYQFSQSQGLQQTQSALAPNVGALSGPTLQALTNYATGNAEQYYNNYFNQAATQYGTNLNSLTSQQNNIFARLSGIAGLGQNAASNVGTAGTSLGTGIAQSTAAAGASQAAGTVGAANAIGGSLGSAGNSYALSSILSNNSASNPLASGGEFNGTSQGTLLSGVGGS
jgi:hypothetical protein